MENLALYLLIIIVPLVIVVVATMYVRRNRLDVKYRDQAAERRAKGDGPPPQG